jgi:hypothetical protein
MSRQAAIVRAISRTATAEMVRCCALLSSDHFLLGTRQGYALERISGTVGTGGSRPAIPPGGRGHVARRDTTTLRRRARWSASPDEAFEDPASPPRDSSGKSCGGGASATRALRAPLVAPHTATSLADGKRRSGSWPCLYPIWTSAFGVGVLLLASLVGSRLLVSEPSGRAVVDRGHGPRPSRSSSGRRTRGAVSVPRAARTMTTVHRSFVSARMGLLGQPERVFRMARWWTYRRAPRGACAIRGTPGFRSDHPPATRHTPTGGLSSLAHQPQSLAAACRPPPQASVPAARPKYLPAGPTLRGRGPRSV